MGAKRWNANTVRSLRRALRLSQQQFAREIGVRQQTVSEWETGRYAPRGASDRLLTLVAEEAGFPYDAAPDDPRRVPRTTKP